MRNGRYGRGFRRMELFVLIGKGVVRTILWLLVYFISFQVCVVNLVERASSIRVFISAILRAFLTGLLLKRRVCGNSTTVQRLASAL